MIYQVKHITKVDYDSFVRLARFNLRLKPAFWHNQNLIEYSLNVSPEPTTISDIEGPYVVNISRLMINEALDELVIKSEFKIEILPSLSDEILISKSPIIENVRRQAIDSSDLYKLTPASYIFSSNLAPMEREITEWAAPFLADNMNIIEGAKMLMSNIYKEFKYDSSATSIDTQAIDSFHGRHGVCQDFAHIMIIALRGHGIPAAYVSGYLRTLPPPGKPKLVGADATHAWVNVWCGNDLGWMGFDPTNNCMTGTDHIFTAMGRDYADVAPVDGVFFGYSEQHMDVSVDVEEIG